MVPSIYNLGIFLWGNAEMDTFVANNTSINGSENGLNGFEFGLNTCQ